MMERITELTKKLFKGELTMKKTDLWLIGGICLLAGILYGIKKAPWTHGVRIGCNNGNNSGNSYSDSLEDEDWLDEDEE